MFSVAKKVLWIAFRNFARHSNVYLCLGIQHGKEVVTPKHVFFLVET